MKEGTTFKRTVWLDNYPPSKLTQIWENIWKKCFWKKTFLFCGIEQSAITIVSVTFQSPDSNNYNQDITATWINGSGPSHAEGKLIFNQQNADTFFQSCNDELSWSGEINESVNKLEKM